MNKTFQALQKEFESSSSRTPEYLAFHRLFKREFTALLKSFSATEVTISKPNHFDVSGFFRDKTGQAWYFRLGDLRGFKDSLLIRTAKDFRDFTGGANQYLNLKDVDSFINGLQRMIS